MRAVHRAEPQAIARAPAAAREGARSPPVAGTDAPLKGSIDASTAQEARIEQAIDQMPCRPALAAARRSRCRRVDDAPSRVLGQARRCREREGPDAAARPDLGLHQPQARQAVSCARDSTEVLRSAGDDRAAGRAARHPRVHRARRPTTTARCAGTSPRCRPTALVKTGKYLMTYTRRGEKLRKELAPPVYEVVAAGRSERRARPHHDPAGCARAHQRTDVARRLADHLRPRDEPRDRQGHGFHRADAVGVEVAAPTR